MELNSLSVLNVFKRRELQRQLTQLDAELLAFREKLEITAKNRESVTRDITTQLTLELQKTEAEGKSALSERIKALRGDGVITNYPGDRTAGYYPTTKVVEACNQAGRQQSQRSSITTSGFERIGQLIWEFNQRTREEGQVQHLGGEWFLWIELLPMLPESNIHGHYPVILRVFRLSEIID